MSPLNSICVDGYDPDRIWERGSDHVMTWLRRSQDSFDHKSGGPMAVMTSRAHISMHMALPCFSSIRLFL